jgi:hypothetical protein
VEPQTSNLVYELADAVTIAWDGMIVHPAPHNTPQPSGRFAEWPVHSLPQFLFDRLQCCTYSLRHGMAMDGEPTMLLRPGTYMCESQKVKRLRSALAALFSPFDRKATELDQTRLSRV